MPNRIRHNTKCWIIATAKHKVPGDIPDLRVEIFKCPKCKCKFRSNIDAAANPAETNFKDIVTKTKEIQKGFTHTLKACMKR